MCVAGLGVFSCSDTYDLDTEQPSGLNSIYGYLEQEGNYTNAMRLIEDLGEKETLSKTGSKTLFVANDDAFAAFFASNPWGVKSYDGLSLAQKKLLLRTAMIDNPFTTSMLSTAEGPSKGEVCRRASSVTLYDSVLAVPSHSALADEILPPNERFDEIRAKYDTIVLFTDNSTAPPMLAFTEKFMTSNKIDYTDIDFVYNQPEGTRQANDVYINNAKVTDPNIFCLNGFIHKVDRVILPLDNMAEVIRKHPQTGIYSSILERFASPSYSRSNSETYKRSTGSNIDTTFVKRYFSDRTYGSGPSSNSNVSYESDDHGVGMPDGAKLKYDPGWNAYLPPINSDRGDAAMQEDLAVMLVPTDAAMDEWWNNGGGAVIKDFYGSLENTPASVLDDLVRANQLISFIGAVPSRFSDVLNDAQEPLGITTADVDSVILACNGAIYLTNKVFAPTSYSSVMFPAVIDVDNFNKIANAIEYLEYDAYLNSMVSNYILLLPTNNGLLNYIDPVSYGRTGTNKDYVQLWEVNYDPSKSPASALSVDVYNATLADDGTVTKNGSVDKHLTTGIRSSSFSEKNPTKNRFTDILDNIIIPEAYNPKKQYYKTKGNTFVRIDGDTEGAKVYGSLQQDVNNPLAVSQVYNMDNGKTLVVDGVPMSTTNSVAKLLGQHPETFSEFLQLLKDADALYKMNSYTNLLAGDQGVLEGDARGNLLNIKDGGTVGAEDIAANKKKVTYLLKNYHYTLYAPTNAAMQEAYRLGLPTHDDLIAAEVWDGWFNDSLKDDAQRDSVVEKIGCCPGDSAARIREVMLDFIKYHIQDNAVFIDEGFATGEYSSGKTALLKIGNDGKYTPARSYKIHVENINAGGAQPSMTVKDNIGNVRNVETDGGLYNMMAREYWYNNTENDAPSNTNLDNSSFVVIHAIDGPLIYADGKHNSLNGEYIEPTQFKYVYKPLVTTE